MQTVATTTLHLREGSSDKVYVPAIVANATGGFNVVAEYGRRGATLQHVIKAEGVDRGRADKEYAKLVTAKVAKGYRPLDGEATAVAAISERDGRSANVPILLLSPLTASQADALLDANPRVVVQEKIDGDRRLLVVNERGDVAGVNRKGLFVPLPPAIVTAASSLPRDTIVDGEIVGETFYAFDAQRVEGCDLTRQGFEVRFGELAATGAASFGLSLVGHVGGDERRPRIAALREAGAEGVVLRDGSAPYKAGRGTGAFKLKFYSTATIAIAAHNDRHSVAMEVYHDGKAIGVGNVTIAPSQALPAIGTFAEVRYLYAFPAGSLYQPTFLRTRDDCDATDCTTAQLSYKATA